MNGKTVGPVVWTLVFTFAGVSVRPAHAAPTFAAGVSQGTVTASGIVEASGIAASGNNDGVLWVHNDSGDVARVFALDTQGQLLGTYNIIDPNTGTYASHTDFEDIAIGSGPEAGVAYLYVGDIGDNGASRANIRVYRIAEPAVYGSQAASPVTLDLDQGEWQAVTLTYPDGAHNAERLMSDPLTGDLFVGTKQSGVSRIYRASAVDLAAGSTVSMTYVAQVTFNVASGGCVSPTGSEIIIRQENFAKLWTRSAEQSVAAALGGTSVSVPVVGQPTEGNGEAVTFDALGDGYFTISEGSNQPLYYFERTSDDGPATPVTLVAAGAEWRFVDDGSDQGVAWRGPAFDDGAWAEGDAQLGYGDGDEQTVVSYGADSNAKHVTTYFRTTFETTNPGSFVDLCVKLLYDDGVAVYLNGEEIVRANLDPNAAYDDAATATQYALENTWFVFDVDPNLLADGTNTIAVEVHQVSPTSSDVSFDLQLVAARTEQTCRLTLTETNGSWGEVLMDPEPNDANDPTFLAGTRLTLTAEPVDGKTFGRWQIFDPNFPNDANRAVIDANVTTTLVMNADRHVHASWQCGSNAAPMLLLILMALALQKKGVRMIFPGARNSS